MGTATQMQLANICSISDICFDLTPYGVQVRYPTHMDLSETDMQTAISGCECTLVFITNKLVL